MKLILFSGDHPRHLFVNKELPQYFDETLVIVMRREEVLPSAPDSLTEHDKVLFDQHFANRHAVEKSTYGDLTPDTAFPDTDFLYINPDELNTEEMAATVRDFGADFCFIFGSNLILDPVIEELPQNKINMHLGLSPWYKGSATLFWPFYHLLPQFCGTTFHQITKQADAGEIIHQCVPDLVKGDRIHDVAAKCVIKAKDDIERVIEHWKNHRAFDGKMQKTTGRNWRDNDFHASQLHVIYDLFDDAIVDRYLSGELDDRQPILFSCIDKD